MIASPGLSWTAISRFIETGYADCLITILEARNKPQKTPGGVGQFVSLTGVGIRFESLHSYLDCNDATHAEQSRWMALRVNPTFFLAFNHKSEAARQTAAVGLPNSVYCGDPGHKFPFVILCTSGVQSTGPHCGFEGWCLPQIQQFRRLDVVVDTLGWAHRRAVSSMYPSSPPCKKESIRCALSFMAALVQRRRIGHAGHITGIRINGF